MEINKSEARAEREANVCSKRREQNVQKPRRETGPCMYSRK